MSAKFLSPLRYEDESEGDQILWLKLTDDFRYWSDVLDSDSVLSAGFECDGESVPRWLFSLVPPFGASRRAGVAHDGLYKFAGYFNSVGEFHSVTRTTADAVYRELMLAAGVSKARAFTRWTTLRAVGWIAWNNHRKAEQPMKNLIALIAVSLFAAGCTTPGSISKAIGDKPGMTRVDLNTIYGKGNYLHINPLKDHSYTVAPDGTVIIKANEQPAQPAPKSFNYYAPGIDWTNLVQANPHFFTTNSVILTTNLLAQ